MHVPIMTTINRNAPTTASYSTTASSAQTTNAQSQRSSSDQTSLRRELDTFQTGINKTQDGRTIDDVAAKQSRAMLEALIDPATARRELTQGVIGPGGDVLKGPPEPGSERAKFLERVASGENIPKEEIMKQAEKVKTSTNCSRIVWDMILSSIIGNLKAEKRQW
jgi:hypothetical protein